MSAEPPERAAPAGFAAGEGGRPARRARPVADLPLDALLSRSGEAARRWALAQVAARPLDAIGGIPLEALATTGPGLCEQVLRALASDTSLGSLLDGGDAGGGADAAAGTAGMPASLLAAAGSARPALLVEVTEALRGTLWELLLEELPGAGADPAAARLLGDVSDRLAQVCAALLAASLEAEPAPAQRPREPSQAPPVPGRDPAPRARAAAEQAGGEHAAEPPIVIVDERRAAYASIERPPFRARVAAEGEGPREPRGFVPLDARAAAAQAAGTEVAGGADISIRDERGDAGPGAWVGSIGRELQRHERDGEPFAVLLLDVRADRAASAAAPPHELLEEALSAELHESGGQLTREHAGRWWGLARHTDRLAAEALAVRLQQVSEAVSRRSGAATSVAIGIAVCPEDGLQAAALAAHADVSLFAARAESAHGPGRSGGSAG